MRASMKPENKGRARWMDPFLLGYNNNNNNMVYDSMANSCVILCAYFLIRLRKCGQWEEEGLRKSWRSRFAVWVKGMSSTGEKPLVLITGFRPLKRLLSTTKTHHQTHFWHFSDFHLVFRSSTHYTIYACCYTI